MRLITVSPKDSVPDLLESDIDNCLIIAHIKRIDTNKIIYAEKYYAPERTLNWFGSDVSESGYEWQHSWNGNLVEFLARSWDFWINVPKMYICETMEDVVFACDEIGITNDVLRLKFYDQFNRIKELDGAIHHDND